MNRFELTDDEFDYDVDYRVQDPAGRAGQMITFAMSSKQRYAAQSRHRRSTTRRTSQQALSGIHRRGSST